jgi:hypothetical protein
MFGEGLAVQVCAGITLSLTSFRPHPFPIKSNRYLHNVGAALPAECGFVVAVFYLFEGGFGGGFGGFAGAGFFICALPASTKHQTPQG